MRPPSPADKSQQAALHASIEAILRRDPGGAYPRSDPRTQWRHHAALRLGEQRTGIDPLAIARAALARAGRALEEEGPESPAAHIGHHLIGGGMEEFERELRALPVYRGTRRAGIQRGLAAPLTVLIACVLVLGCAAYLLWQPAAAWARIAALVCAVPLAAVYASRTVRALRWRPRMDLPLPRLRPEDGEPRRAATLVVVPAIVPSPERARALLDRLWALHQAHGAAEFRFALLSDFADAATATTDGDGAVLAELEAGIAGLNARAGDAAGDRFLALHRVRRWSATQQAWMGWERKRGKLLELMRLLHGDPAAFAWRFGDVGGLLSRTPIPLVITLDDTTRLKAGAADALIRTALHPLNLPRMDERTGRVVSGYGVLQPSVEFTFGGADDDAEPARRAAGPSFAFTALGAGVHQGAGALYHVDAFRRALDGTFPDDLVLHHDLLDGFVARTGEVYDAVVQQPWPATYLAQARRGHRWLRGLLQAAPFIAGLRGNPLTGAQRFFLGEASLVELGTPASLVLLLLGWTVLPGPAWTWTVAACPALLLPFLSLLQRTLLLPLRKGRGARPGAALGRLAMGAFAQVVLVHQSLVAADALVRVAWRMGVSRRRLLEWAPRREPASPYATPLSEYWRALWLSPVAGASALAAVAWWRPHNLPLAAPFALAWIAAPAIVGLGDRLVFRPGAERPPREEGTADGS